MEPIRPCEARHRFNKELPAFVIEAVNNLIVANLDSNGHSGFTYKELKQKIQELNPDKEGDFNSNWLDIENIFTIYGWNVVVDNPGYCESYEGNYKFSPKKD
jgi:hypothetical protein